MEKNKLETARVVRHTLYWIISDADICTEQRVETVINEEVNTISEVYANEV